MIWTTVRNGEKKTKNQLTKEISVRPSSCCGTWWAFLWCRQTPSADSGIIIRFCISSWPISPTPSLCCVWYFLSPSWVALIFCLSRVVLSSHSLCCWSRDFIWIPCQKVFEPYQANIPFWVHFGVCSRPPFSQPPFPLFLQSSGSRSGLFPVNIDSVLHHEPFLQLLSFAFVTATPKFLNKFQAAKALWEEHCFPHSHFAEAKTEVEGSCTHSFLSRAKLSSRVICPATPASSSFPLPLPPVLIRS